MQFFAQSEETEVELSIRALDQPGVLSEHHRRIRVLITAYEFRTDDQRQDRYLVVRKGPLSDGAELRIESACIGHTFGFVRCDCRDQLDISLNAVADHENYILIYGYDQEGQGHGPVDHINIIKKVDEQGASESALYPDGDRRNYENIGFILKNHLGLNAVRLHTNNPQKIKALEQHGLRVDRVSITTVPRPETRQVLAMKQNFEGHLPANPALD